MESGNIGNEQTKANQTISYKGKITATGGTIESHILDFNASLDLKNSATLTADYLTLTDKDSVKLDGASATIQNLILKNVSDLTNKITITNGTSQTSTFKVEKSFWFDNSNFDLSKLDSAHIDKTENYDIVGVKSTITGTSKDLIANVSLFEEANLTLKSLTLKDTKANEVTPNGTTNAIKNSVYLQGESTTNNNLQTNTTTTKLTINAESKGRKFK